MTDLLNSDIKDIRINGVWQILKKIGSGSFGSVYTAINIENNQLSAIKFEEANRVHELAQESRVIKNLEKGGGFGIPKLLWYGADANVQKYI